MPRTLIISDLHIGGRFFHTVLTRTEPLERLLAALDDVDRLVLLGDSVELVERRPQRAMEIARPIITAIGRRLGPDKEVIVVPGNHDLPLVRPWIWQVRDQLELTSQVPPDATPGLAAFVSWLAPAQVSVRYPGVWLGDGVFALHGHYLDVHLVPVSSYGFARGRLRRPAQDRATPFSYELRRRHRAEGGRPARSGIGGSWLLDEVGYVIASATSAVIKHQLMRPSYSGVNARVLRTQVNHAGLPALGRVVDRLGVDAEFVIFAHCHRLGPLPDDDPGFWHGPGGRPRLFNTGSWLYEPLVVQGVTPPHPYWPGGAVLLEPGREPQVLRLLDDLGAQALRTDL